VSGKAVCRSHSHRTVLTVQNELGADARNQLAGSGFGEVLVHNTRGRNTGKVAEPRCLV